MTAEEYLALERVAEGKSEFWHGEVFAMAGATDPHSRIRSNIHFYARLRLRGRGCAVHQADMKVGAAKRSGFAYPDMAVVCGNGKFFDSVLDVLMNPTAIFEVLSDSTRTFDLTAKLAEYQKIESLRHYVAVEQKSRAVYHCSRPAGAKWSYEILDAQDAALSLTALQIELPLSEIYEDILWPSKRRKSGYSARASTAETCGAMATIRFMFSAAVRSDTV